ncbi:M28 family peptidase [Vibrio lamellibrachiae]|uniref:M28 family peptidase n=1 Tax=Vibrio lamellibrachiae TaxID=2910253 RepID=UPI003D12CFE0
MTTEKDNGMALATSPAQVIDRIVKPGFLPGSIVREKTNKTLIDSSWDLGIDPLKSRFELGTDVREAIEESYIYDWSMKMKDVSVQSKEAGDILWGRVQGTIYEHMAFELIEQELKSLELDEVHYEKYPCQYPQWRPTTCDIEVMSAPNLEDGDTYKFSSGLTTTISKLTPKGGAVGELIYVGEGSASELRGRDLEGKIVLLRGKTMPSAVLNSARVAFSRIATGKYGEPQAVIVWWDTPVADQVGGRVGAPGGGDIIGALLPWITIGDDDGLYLRKMLDNAEDGIVKIRVDIQGQEERDRMSGNVWAKLEGKQDKYIIIPAHVDCFMYGVHDNGTSIAMNLALAKYYAALDKSEREYGIIFMFQGDHEVPGLGNTKNWAIENQEWLEDRMLMILRPEHVGMIMEADEGALRFKSNVTVPAMLHISNQSPVLSEIFRDTINQYQLPTSTRAFRDPSADEMAFYPPHTNFKKQPISAGWITGGKYYHSTADVQLDLICFESVTRFARAHAYIIDRVGMFSEDQLRDQSNYVVPGESIYSSDAMLLALGGW